MEPKTTLTIVYSPQYDGEVYLGDAPSEMGTLYLGIKGLMDFLSLRAGIPVTIKSDVEREADYMNAMNTYLGKKRRDKVFFKDAAKVDAMGVAAKLLRWRDALIMAGWNCTCADKSCLKLVALAEIESYFHSAGTADCWRKLCDAYCNKDILKKKVDKVRLDCTWMDIPEIIRQTLAAIQKYGVELETNCCQQELDIEKVELVEFEDVDDAYEWIAQAELPQGTAIVNRDNIRLNHTLKTWNRPQVAASLKQSNPQLLQLFKLSMSIFSRPLNIHNLVSYLQLPMNPIPSDLRFSLVKILMDNGGFGDKKERNDGVYRDDWEETIAQYKFLDDKGEESNTVKKNKLFFLKPIRSDYTDGISKAELTDYIGKLMKWANGFKSADEFPEERASQLNELISQLKSFSTTLETQENTLQYADLVQLVMQIYRPMNYKLQQPEAGCLNVISDVRAMAKPAKTLIWLDCQQEDAENDPYDFLSANERIYLEANKVVIPDFAEHLENVHTEQIYKLNQAGCVILVKSAYDGTTRLGEHSFVAEVKYLGGNNLRKTQSEKLFKMREVETEEGTIDVYQPALAYDLGEIEYSGRKESNDSIDMLINFPFNYVMKYVAKLPNPDTKQLQNTYTVTGLVAHNFFQHIIDDGNENLKKMRELTKNEFSQRLEASIDATGLILRLPENATTLNNFRSHLRESMLALIDIMEHCKLRPVGCEKSFPEDENQSLEIETIGDFGARIDLVLQNENDQYVIFDFKWSYGKKYREKLENNTAIQLELYKQAVMASYKDKDVAGVGYFLMPVKQLITTDYDEIEGKELIRRIQPTDTSQLFLKLKNSYTFRMNEIRRGHVEEAETMDVMNEAEGYYANIDSKTLCPLSVQEDATGRGRNRVVVAIRKKSEQIFRPSLKPSFEDESKKNPSEIATSHPVLKGRLK